MQWPVVAVAIAAAFAVVLVLLATRNGPGVGSDSTQYLSGARNLANGKGYVNFSLEPITIFPPGFSSTLSVGDRLAIDPIDGARWWNAVAFAALVVSTFVLARRHVRSPWLAVAAAAAVALSPTMLGVFTFAISEPTFNVLAMAMLLVLEPLMARRGRDRRLLFLAAVIGGCAFLYRFAGVAVLASAAVVIAIGAWRDGRSAALRRALFYVAVAGAVPALVIARNLSEGSGPLGTKFSSEETLGGLGKSLARRLSGWTLDSRFPESLRYVVLAGAGALVLTGLGVAIRRVTQHHGTDGHPLFPVVSFVAGYFTFLMVSELVTNIDRIEDRFLAPMFAPSVVLAAFAGQQLLDLDWTHTRRWVTAGLGAVLALWLTVSFVASADRARHHGHHGQGFASRSSLASELTRHVERLPRGARVYSNMADAIYHATGRQPVYWSPARTAYRSDTIVNEIPKFRKQVNRMPNIFLAWYDGTSRNYLFTPAALRRQGFSLKSVVKARDGTLYAVTNA